jgi:hypothetical protein
LYFALDLALDRALTPAIDRALTRALTRDLALALGRALVLALDLDHALTVTRDLDRIMERLLDRCRQLGRIELCERLAPLEVPAASAPAKTRQAFADRLEAAIESQGALQRYRQLQAEAEALSEEQEKRWRSFDRKEVETLIAYLQSTRLFYDCLQLAYTPHRDEFEERILAPPP